MTTTTNPAIPTIRQIQEALESRETICRASLVAMIGGIEEGLGSETYDGNAITWATVSHAHRALMAEYDRRTA